MNRLEQELAQLNRMRAAAIAELRLAFEVHGFDVQAFSDDQLSSSVLHEAISGTRSEKDLFARAFGRLKR